MKDFIVHQHSKDFHKFDELINKINKLVVKVKGEPNPFFLHHRLSSSHSS